jgi:hypothetical protein
MYICIKCLPMPRGLSGHCGGKKNYILCWKSHAGRRAHSPDIAVTEPQKAVILHILVYERETLSRSCHLLSTCETWGGAVF